MVRRRPALEAHIALTGKVPATPVAVSARDAREAQTRAAQAEPARVERETPDADGSARSLGSMIRALERRSGYGQVGAQSAPLPDAYK